MANGKTVPGVIAVLLLMALCLCAIAGILAGVAFGLSMLLMALMPALQAGHAIIAGAIMSPVTLYAFLRLITTVISITPGEYDTEDEEPELTGVHDIHVTPREFLSPLHGGSKSGRKKKKK